MDSIHLLRPFKRYEAIREAQKSVSVLGDFDIDVERAIGHLSFTRQTSFQRRKSPPIRWYMPNSISNLHHWVEPLPSNVEQKICRPVFCVVVYSEARRPHKTLGHKSRRRTKYLDCIFMQKFDEPHKPTGATGFGTCAINQHVKTVVLLS